VSSSEAFERWARGTGMVAIATLAWGVFVPQGLFWNAVLATGLVGAAVATALVARSRWVPSLAQVIGSRNTSGAGLRTRGER